MANRKKAVTQAIRQSLDEHAIPLETRRQMEVVRTVRCAPLVTNMGDLIMKALGNPTKED